uniref:Uncharacterized protein n=1 Tax=Rhizophora mucronata TaxID=61149 RepID=A0A2P2NPB9_RHIMU
MQFADLSEHIGIFA